jgi:hypothetical protein
VETKSGYKTTEFWVSLLVSGGSLVAALAGNLPPKYAAIATAVSGGLYAVGRGVAKSGVKPGP